MRVVDDGKDLYVAVRRAGRQTLGVVVELAVVDGVLVLRVERVHGAGCRHLPQDTESGNW